MKIYPNTSTLTVTKEVNSATDIPLSYIDTNAISYDIDIITNEKYKIKAKKEVLPYDRIGKNALCLFDDMENEIDYNTVIKSFKRDKNEYVYVPYGSQSFIPKTFSYSVTGKKTMTYSSDKIYNMNVLIYKNPILSNKFISICGDASSRLMAPANIFINNGDLSMASLTERSEYNTDFTMMSCDFKFGYGYGYKEGMRINLDVNIESILKKNRSNLIAVIAQDEAEGEIVHEKRVFTVSAQDTEYKMKSPIIYDEVTYTSRYYFSIPKNSSTCNYYSLFNIKDKTPILIEERIGIGFVIYVTEELINNSIHYSNVIYETLLNVFFRSYKKTDIIDEWIADEVPDFIVNNNKLIKKDMFISNVELYKMFGMEKDEIINYEVGINSNIPFVNFIGMHENYLIFKKNTIGDNKIYSDIPKPEGSMSIYTQRKNIIYYNDFIYSINDSIEDCIEVKRSNENIIINLKPFRHSTSGIYIKNHQEPIIIPLIKVINNKEVQIQNAVYYLVVEPLGSASYFKIVSSDEYKESDGNILTTIKIKQNSSEKIVYDMRQRGGGLPSTEKDNYECFDIGHIKGRPYRKAGTLIITLPKYLEQHKELISETINQYRVAEDYPIIIFKED